MTPDMSPYEKLARDALSYALSGNWSTVLALALVAFVMLARKFLAPKIPALYSDLGAIGFTFLAGVAGAIVTAATAGANPLAWATFAAAIGVTWKAMGGYAMIKKALIPLAVYFLPKIPFVGKYLAAAMAKLGAPPAAEAMAKATAAGDAAVRAKPAPGVSSVVDFEDLE